MQLTLQETTVTPLVRIQLAAGHVRVASPPLSNREAHLLERDSWALHAGEVCGQSYVPGCVC